MLVESDRNYSLTVWYDCLVVTLAFDSSPIKGEGIVVGCVGLIHPRL